MIIATKGLASVILLNSAKQFSQSVVLDYAPKGLRYELELQLSAIEASKTSQAGKQRNAQRGFYRFRLNSGWPAADHKVVAVRCNVADKHDAGSS